MNPISEVYNMDCVEYMKSIPHKYFDLAICDPPYGIGQNWKKDKGTKLYNHTSSYKNNTIPDKEYFDELFRVSKNQIIWGGNYFTEYLPARNSWIVWDKKRNFVKQKMSEGELAWTSFNIPLRIAEFMWCGAVVCEKRYGKHPHEKPTMLYKWLLSNYAKQGNRILDTHLGSGSSRIASYKMGFDFYACEIDRQYFDAQEERFRCECFGEMTTKTGKLITQIAIKF